VNVVPTEHTRDLARTMIKTARQETGADAVIAHLDNVRWDQIPALVGILLGALNMAAANTPTNPERPPIDFVDGCRACYRTDQGIHGRGLCRNCYARHKNAGTLDRYPPLQRATADTIADWTELQAQGCSVALAAQRMGMTKAALEKAIRRHQRRETEADQAIVRRRAGIAATLREQEAS